MADIKNNKPVLKSLKEYARGIIGGLIFSLPMLYTMEVWWAGFRLRPVPLLVFMVFTYILLLGYNRFSGVRPDTDAKQILIDSVEEMGIGFAVSFLILLLLDRLHLSGIYLNETLGKVIIEAMAVSVGVSIGRAQLGDSSGQEDRGSDSARNSMWGLAVLAVCGSVVVGVNVAPTQEIQLLGIEAEPVHILTMAAISVGICLVVMDFSDFRGTAKREGSRGEQVFDMLLGTSVCYLSALLTSAFLLWFFGRLEHMGLWVSVSQVIVLGVPSALGASAGRLLIK